MSHGNAYRNSHWRNFLPFCISITEICIGRNDHWRWPQSTIGGSVNEPHNMHVGPTLYPIMRWHIILPSTFCAHFSEHFSFLKLDQMAKVQCDILPIWISKSPLKNTFLSLIPVNVDKKYRIPPFNCLNRYKKIQTVKELNSTLVRNSNSFRPEAY